MDENGAEFDFDDDDDDEDIPNTDENDKAVVDDLSDVEKLLKSDAVNKDDDDLDDSDDSDKESIAVSRNPSETITEDKVRSFLVRKQFITFTELIQNFLPKSKNLRTKEIKEGIVQKLATILKHLNIEEKIINGKKHIKLTQFN